MTGAEMPDSTAKEIFRGALEAFRQDDPLEAWLMIMRAAQDGLCRADAVKAIGEAATDELREGMRLWALNNPPG